MSAVLTLKVNLAGLKKADQMAWNPNFRAKYLRPSILSLNPTSSSANSIHTSSPGEGTRKIPGE